MTYSLRDLARELESIRKSIRDKGSTPQLGTSSIENGKILEHDINGVVKQQIGLQHDGTNTTVQFNGPTPPAPTKPTFELQNSSVRVSWDGQWVDGVVSPMDLARIDVHFIDDLSDDPMEMPPRGSILSQGWGDVALPLIPGDYHAVLVARTTSGSYNASEPSDVFTVTALTAGSITETEIADDSISTPKLQTNAITTDKIAAGAVTANEILAGSVGADQLAAVVGIIGKLQAGGNVEVSEPTNVDGVLDGGVIIYDPISREVLVRLHPEGNFFRGGGEFDVLTVLTSLVVNGELEVSSGGKITLRNGVSDPATGPDWAVSPLWRANWPQVPAGHARVAISWDATNDRFVELLTRTSDNLTRYRYVSTTGVATPSTPIDFIASLAGTGLAGSVGFVRATSVTTIGASIYVTAVYIDAFFNEYTVLHKSVLATGLRQGEVQLGTISFAGHDPAVGNDGTSLFAVFRDDGTGTPHRVQKFNTSFVSAGIATLDGGGYGDTYIRRFVGVGDFGYGSSKLTVAYTPAAGGPAKVDVYPLPTFTGDNVNVGAALSFELDQPLTYGGICFKTTGADQFFYSTHSDGKMWLWDDYYPAAGEKFWGQSVDTGAGAHTDASPTTSISVGKRRFAFATLRPAPPGVTGSELYVGYGATAPATKYKRSEPITGRTFLLLAGKDTSGSTSVPSGNTFGSAPSIFKSEVGGAEIRGDGYAKLPGLVNPYVRYVSSGTIVAADGVPKTLTPYVVGDAPTQTSGGDDFTKSGGSISPVVPGVYDGLLSFNIEADPTMTGARIVQIMINGTPAGTWNDACMTAGTYSHQVTFRRRLIATDVITAVYTQNSGGDLDISGTLSLIWSGA